jgi:hypothetical protein
MQTIIIIVTLLLATGSFANSEPKYKLGETISDGHCSGKISSIVEILRTYIYKINDGTCEGIKISPLYIEQSKVKTDTCKQ